VVLLVYLALPIDAGPNALAKHWPGAPEGLIALKRLCRLNER
jgi:hypothetical protein